jgi:molybdate transport system substrate-binding protein
MKCAGVIIGLAFALGTRAEAAEIKVISTGGARAVMTSLVPEFERKSGHKVRTR